MQFKSLVILASGLATIVNAGTTPFGDVVLDKVVKPGEVLLDKVVELPLKFVDPLSNAPVVNPEGPQCTEAELEISKVASEL
ncbi:hypothetical protein C0992_005481 [Termitomyces sp. T32_za158]|nr:hypothetical protein C0992_005481 [Termitomyces sp. T32_za158]